ncbi:MAG: hypothetical protein ACYDC3_07940, partial [Candidatus Binataceae bacterium]
AGTIADSVRIASRMVLIAVIIAFVQACAATGRRAALPPAVAAGDPATLVFRNCPELVCTDADVRRCDFSQVIASDGPDPQREDFRCARSGHGTLCEERRALVGSEDTSLENQVLKFQCSGDPVQCQKLGGNAPWTTTLELPDSSRASLSCRAPHPPGPAPASHAIPGPDTV